MKCLISINQYTLYIDVSHLKFLCEITTKNCANGPKLVLKALCEKSFVRNVRLPYLSNKDTISLIHSHLPLSLWKDDNIIISLNEEKKACPLTINSSVGHHQFKMIVPGRLTLKISCENFLNLSLYILNV